MKRFVFSSYLVLVVFLAAANAQFFTSETTRKANEKMKQGDRAGAISILDQAIERRKDLLEAYQMRASLRSMTGDLDGAIADYSTALEINPNDAALYERRGRFRAFRRDAAGALQDFDAAITSGRKTENLYTARASVKHDIGDIEGAIADYQTALGINPNFASAHNGLAFTLQRKGDLDGAILHLEQFLNGYEGRRDGRLPNLKGETSAGTSVEIKREGKEKDGLQGYLTGQEVAAPFTANSPEEMERQQAKYEQLMNLVVTYANLGGMYAKKNEFDKALDTWEKGLKIRKGDFYIHKLRSEVRIKKGDLQGAIEDLTVVANSPRGAPDRHFDKGLLLILQGKDSEAEKEFALHQQVFPDTEASNKRIEAARKLVAHQSQQ